MGVYEGRATLSKALAQLESRWLDTMAEWDDARKREFEQRFLMPMRQDLKNAVSAMDQVAVLLSTIHSACE